MDDEAVEVQRGADRIRAARGRGWDASGRRVPPTRDQRSHVLLWKKKFAHLGVSELRRLRQLEEENGRLKCLVADLTLDKHILAETIRKNR
jgi:putative transposase